MIAPERLGFDPAQLDGFLKARLGGLEGAPAIVPIAGGQSNPTFFVDYPNCRLVLRKKPAGATLPSAHAVDREFRVLRALLATDVPVPRALLFHGEPDIVGTPFYVMNRLEGRVFADAALPGLDPAARSALYRSMAETLARLHAVDPVAVGLAEFGRPGNYFERQMARWSAQWAQSPADPIPELDAVEAWLRSNLPPDDGRVAIAHGDFRVGNLMIHPTDPHVVGILDWELSTLGHPLADLGYCCMPWHTGPDEYAGILGLDHAGLGLPTQAEFVAHYMAHARPTGPLAEAGTYPLDVIEPLKAKARSAGLWNLFLPGLRDDEPGTRLCNLDYAPLAEIMGRIPWASEVFNCSAPDTGNMEVLHLFATPDQRTRWLDPLLAGEIRSVVSITEPDVASSDPTNLQTTIRRDGNDYVIDGRKWFNTGALHPHARMLIVMGVSNPVADAARHHRHSFVIVPMDTPGFRIVRNVPIMNHLAPEGHCEVTFDHVRVPVGNLLGAEHEGFAIAQARLGPGRIHHCMRTIGQCELALELMTDRALQRQAFGRKLGDYANNQDEIALSRIEIDQARLLCLRAAWLMDTQGNQAARVDVSAIKVVAARLQTRLLDRAIQIFGAMGLSNDTPLAYLWTWGRALRFIDGPDEVHVRVVSRAELTKAKVRASAV